MYRSLVILVASAASCSGFPRSPESPDAARLRALMGRNDRLKLEIQLLTAEPEADREIAERIGRMIESLREVSDLEPFEESAKNVRLRALAPQAIGRLEIIRAARWTPETRENLWARLETSCAICHSTLK